MGGVRDTDKGYRKLVNTLSGNPKTRITVGVHEVAGQEIHPGTTLTVAELATIHEFGTDTIPERSFLRAWFDENRERCHEAVKRMAQSVMRGERSREDAIEILGQTFVAQIQKRIAKGIPPPNSPATIAAKGSSTPLIDTGILRTSITYAVDKVLSNT